MKIAELSPSPPDIETERLTLRKLRVSDVKSLSEWISDPEAYKYWAASPAEFEIDPIAYFTNEDKIDEYYGEPFDYLDWFIFHKEDNKIIGEVLFYSIESDYQCEIGYRLSKAYRGKGFAEEAVRSAIDTVFKITDIKRITAHIDVKNEVSEKLIKRLSFTYEGTNRRMKICDTVSNWNVYALIKEN
jgi:ribosomal-protein-alanine N-acetyltransferase